MEKLRHVTLDQEEVRKTATRLLARIQERFRHSRLIEVAESVVDHVEHCPVVKRADEQPNVWLRLVVALLAAVVLFLAGYGVYRLQLDYHVKNVSDFLQASESGLQIVILCSLGILTAFSLERHLRRRKQRRFLDSLRSIAHLVNLHQLDKDPDRLGRDDVDFTESSPRLTHVNSIFLMSRYLDYCSELLALIPVIATIYTQGTNDSAIQATLDEIEGTCERLRGCIGQKMIVLGVIDSEEHSKA